MSKIKIIRSPTFFFHETAPNSHSPTRAGDSAQNTARSLGAFHTGPGGSGFKDHYDPVRGTGVLAWSLN